MTKPSSAQKVHRHREKLPPSHQRPDASAARAPRNHAERTGRLRALSRQMADKITTLPRSKVGQRIGRLSDEDVARLNRALLVFLGIAAQVGQQAS